MTEIVWDYLGLDDESPLPWPQGMPVPHAGDWVYAPDRLPRKVARVSYYPDRDLIYITCEKYQANYV